MKKMILAVVALCLALCAALAARHYRSGMEAAEVIRKLSGLRMALALYKLEHKTFPSAFEDVLRDGKLEAAPRLKLPWHSGSSAVRNTPSLDVRDSGGWAYVSDPRHPGFGLVFIDCTGRDEKGRYWSEF